MNADMWHGLGERLKALGTAWPTYTVVGSFLLYLLGYLALRFHLTALGVGADLMVLDERYLFTGARFLVYLVSAVLKIVLLALLSVLVVYLPCRLLPRGMRDKAAAAGGRAVDWWRHPGRLALAGIVLSVIIIQFVMVQCFAFSNLLLLERFPPLSEGVGGMLGRMLLAESGSSLDLYFLGLIAGCGISGGLWLALRGIPPQTAPQAALRAVFVTLAVVQFLLLPVNYGYLIVDKTVPRVATLNGITPLPPGEEAWLVWEGKEGLTFLVRKGPNQKSLLTLPRSEVKRVELIAYDRILRRLFVP